MTETPDGSASEESLLDQIRELIQHEVPDSERESVETFAGMYLRRLSEAELPDLAPDRLLAEIRDLLAFVDARPLGDRGVRVFIPAMEESGYTAEGSMVQVVAEDSPFLADSVTAAITGAGCHIVRHLHPVVGTTRSQEGRLIGISHARASAHRESVQTFALAEALSEQASRDLELAIRGVLVDVARSVRDFHAMSDVVRDRMISTAKAGSHFYDFEEVAEAVAFLEWLLDDNFVFLGYREYEIVDIDGDTVVRALADSGLGILETSVVEPSTLKMSDLPEHLQDRFGTGDLLVITKTNRHATVHRDARMDYVGLREVDDQGRTVLELRMLGLFTSKAYMTPASEIPVLTRKLARVLQAQDVIEGSHDYKSLIQVYESFPKDDLFAMPVDALSDTLGELVETEESSAVRLFVRRDTLNRFVSVLVTVPRDRFNADFRKELQGLFVEVFEGTAIDYRLALGESGDARIHFSVWVEEGSRLDVDIAELEKTVIAMARNWDDRVIDELAPRIGEKQAASLGSAWTPLFPDYYKSSTGLDIAAGDVINLQRLADSGREVFVALQNEDDVTKAPAAADKLTRITVYRSSGKLNLSEMMPLIEDLGVVVVEEVPTRLTNESGTFIHDFGVLSATGEQLDVDRVGDRIAEAIADVLLAEAESDSLNRLLVSTDLSHTELDILRAYRSYWRLVTPAFSGRYVDDALAAQPGLAETLVRFFEARFAADHDESEERPLIDAALEGINAVESLDEDRILRGFLGLILATERSNLHVEGRSSLALKFFSARVPDMPEPMPLHEIYVYAQDVEGVHLRGGQVARGGIRWSDRREDYRTEVLGLMKAQMTKNVVIVPTGAKGGFVVKRSTDALRPTYDEVREAYEIFVRGLLDVTDNRVSDEVVHPRQVVCHDEFDPYLVVAADKGTASFSDTANAISASYGFWLDDAFASGGSAGYDHKALGITAKGAWESVRRHFLDIGIDVDTDPITVVGIGDMSGDVFGNGMLLSRRLELVAAFDHRHVFIDPDPDAAVGWAERMRLSELDRSSWDDYDRSLISSGGGVFPRTAKRIDLTPEMQRAIGTDVESATPSQLIALILQAPVDLLWNGGIGTYVKSRGETHGLVQDRANDAVRVDGRDLRCKVVGEGGNLGFTQRGRIEFEMSGGLIFADFIDNSGGVNASDREVNLKILLRMAEESGEITRAERDEIIDSVSDDVVDAILYDNFLQAQIISQEAVSSAFLVEAYADLMDRLEREGLLNRDIEFLPSSEDMAQRAREGMGLTRPEISVLLAYAKMSLTEHLRVSSLPDDPHFEEDLLRYFPPAIVGRFREHILKHPLRRDLISTIVANQVLNSQGSTYYSRLRTISGASAAMIVRAYRIARIVTGAPRRWSDIEALNASVPSETTRGMLRDVDRLVTLVSRWYLVHPSDRSIDAEIALAADDFAALSDRLPKIDMPEWREPYEAVAKEYEEMGVPSDLATRHAFQRALRRAPDMVDLAQEYDKDVLDIAAVYTTASQQFYIGWLERQIRLLPGATAFERLAIESLRDDLQRLRRDVVATILDSEDATVAAYTSEHERVMPRLERWYRWVTRDGIEDVSASLIASRRLRQILIP